MWEQEFIEELMTYVGFTPDHARTLAELMPVVERAFGGIVDRFYQAIMDNERARAVFVGGDAQIARQKVHLTAWLREAFGGVYDAEYLAKRSRIGRTHVRINLDQRYMFSAMNLVREGLHDAVSGSTWQEPRLKLAHSAIDKLCDLELAVMLETYSEDHVQRLRDRERLATLGQIAGFIGHELRNPLAVMETSLHLLRKRLPHDDENAVRHLNRLNDQVSVSGQIITDLLELARDRSIERDQVNIANLITDTLADLPLSSSALVAVEVEDGLPMVWLDQMQLRLLINNLVGNAAQALSTRASDKLINVRGTRKGDALILTVEDNGPGIAEDIRHRLFEPLTTTHDKGLGLGLALCRRIVEKHEGEIHATNRREGGARFEVRLPRCFRDGSS